jgi:hypothetical protein
MMQHRDHLITKVSVKIKTSNMLRSGVELIDIFSIFFGSSNIYDIQSSFLLSYLEPSSMNITVIIPKSSNASLSSSSSSSMHFYTSTFFEACHQSYHHIGGTLQSKILKTLKQKQEQEKEKEKQVMSNYLLIFQQRIPFFLSR